MRKILGQEASSVCGSWFRKIQKIEDVAEGKLMCLGLLGWGGAEGTVRLGNPEWETWLGSAGAQELLWVVLQDRELLWAALALIVPSRDCASPVALPEQLLLPSPASLSLE